MSGDGSVLESLYRDLCAKLGELTSSDEWLDWLRGARRFHRHSPRNQMLLMLQGAQGHVASYRTWQRIPAVGGGTCQVRRGQHGLRIIAPLTTTHRSVDETTGKETVSTGIRGFRPVKVFHQGQLVAPPDLPEQPPPALLTGPDRWQHVWAAVIAQLAGDGFDVALHTAGVGETWNGRTNFLEGEVKVMDHLDAPQRLKTLLHEWAHVTLDHGQPRESLTRQLREVEAESVAYLLCSTIGLDSSSYSIPYLAGWSGGDGQLAHTTAHRVLDSTATMIAALETRLGVDLTPDSYSVARSAVRTLAVASAGKSHDQTPAPVPDGTPTVTEASHSAIEQAPAPLSAVLGHLDPADRPHLVAAAHQLDDAHALAVAVGLCADAGLDASATATALAALGADRVALRREMKQPLVDLTGHTRSLFDDVDAAFRTGPMPAAITELPTNLQARLLEMDVDSFDDVQPAVAVLRDHLHPGEIVQALTWLGVDESDICAAVGEPTPAPEALELLRCRVTEHETLLRRVVDEVRDPNRVAALATGLGMTYTETITACARVGLDPEFAAQVALARRHGQITLAANDLAEGWTAPPPNDGWAAHLPFSGPGDHEQESRRADRPAARAILAQWAEAAAPAPTPTMP